VKVKIILTGVVLSLFALGATGQSESPAPKTKIRGDWRTATAGELKAIIPARAPVEKERIETELRSATGITDGRGKAIAAVLLITAGYSAQGKYSHFLIVQSPLRVGDVELRPGEYVFGYRRSGDALEVSFYESASGRALGTVQAIRNDARRVVSFRILPPTEGSLMQLGRFVMRYELLKE
jgi:hypothetical protein